MNIDILRITNAEIEIMEFLWRIGRPATTAEIGCALAHRRWKPSTIRTLAIRLANRAIIKYYRANGRNYYFPIISESDYDFMMVKTLVNTRFGGSPSDMTKMLLCDMELTREEISKLQELIINAVLPRDMANEAEPPKVRTIEVCEEVYEIEVAEPAQEDNCIHETTVTSCEQEPAPKSRHARRIPVNTIICNEYFVMIQYGIVIPPLCGILTYLEPRRAGPSLVA